MTALRLRALGLLASCAIAGCGGAVDVTDRDEGDGGDSAFAPDAYPDTITPDTITPDTITPDTIAPDTIAPDDTAPADDTALDDAPFDAPSETSADTRFDALDALDAPPVDAPSVDCSTTPVSVDPSPTDPLADGPLKVGHKTYVVPKLDPLTAVNVRVTYPLGDDGVTPHAGKHAWIMFHHAVHGPYPGVIYDQYDKIFDRWASHGFVVFSIDGARIYFPTAAGTNLTWPQQQTVAGLMDQAITYFLAQQSTSTFELACRLDPTRLGVAGHSRGGGAALLVPTTRTDGAKIKAYLGFQPVNPEALSPPAGYAIPGFDLPALWLDAALDGDVVYPISAMEYSRARGRATHVTILGSKHTFTLDAPFPDQGGTPATITPDEHKAVCNQYGLSFLRAYVRDATPSASDVDRIFGPSGMSTTASSGNVQIRWKTPVADASWLSRFDEPSGGGAGKTEAGDAITTEGALTAASFETYASSTAGFGGGTIAISHLIRSVKLTWDATGGALVVPLRAGALVSKKSIVFETAEPEGPLTGAASPLVLEVVDSAGGKGAVDVASIVGPGFVLRSRRLSIAYAALSKLSGVDLAKATSIRFAPKIAAAGTAVIDVLRIE